MKANFLELYEAMIRDLKEILSSALPEKEIMENCFRCCIGHWNKLKVKIKTEGFASDGEEIHFFKNIKPLFTGEIEYYTLRYHALQFLPDTDKRTKEAFWSGELNRIDKFFGFYHEFFTYWTNAKTERDCQYFLRRNSEENGLTNARVFDMDEETTTNYGSLLSIMIGYNKYKKYILEEMEKCT